MLLYSIFSLETIFSFCLSILFFLTLVWSILCNLYQSLSISVYLNWSWSILIYFIVSLSILKYLWLSWNIPGYIQLSLWLSLAILGNLPLCWLSLAISNNIYQVSRIRMQVKARESNLSLFTTFSFSLFFPWSSSRGASAPKIKQDKNDQKIL